MLTTRPKPVHTDGIDEKAVSVRASDADRERVARSLRQHLMAGRLVAEEFEERIERAYTAKTLDELSVLTRDLPVVQSEQRPRRRRLWPGNHAFAARVETNVPVASVMSEAMRTIAPELLAVRYRVEQSDASRLVFRRQQIPFYAVAAAILIPIIGLVVLAAAARESSEVIISANEVGPGRTVVDIFGVASLRVRRAMLELEH